MVLGPLRWLILIAVAGGVSPHARGQDVLDVLAADLCACLNPADTLGRRALEHRFCVVWTAGSYSEELEKQYAIDWNRVMKGEDDEQRLYALVFPRMSLACPGFWVPRPLVLGPVLDGAAPR